MRVLRYFIQYTVLIAFLLIAAGLIARESILFYSIQQLQASINKMDTISRRLEDYDLDCRGIGGPGTQAEHVHLRFLDSRRYALEVSCLYFPDQPIEIQSFSFLPYARKMPGKSGIIWNPATQASLTVEVFDRRTTVLLNEEIIKIKQGVHNVEGGNMPVTSCTGYGYACCDEVTSVGEGESIFGTQVSDCQQSCYEVCSARPTVLQLTSDPSADLSTNTVTVSSGSEITFYYTIDPANNLPVDRVIDFGDGAVAPLDSDQSTTSHVYSCPQSECRYTVSIRVTDSKGVQSAQTQISMMSVIVR